MKTFIRSYYDKIVLVLSFFLFLLSFVYLIFSESTSFEQTTESSFYELFYENNEVLLSFYHVTQIMPGNKIYFRRDDAWESSLVHSITLERNSEIEVTLKDGNIVNGSARKDCFLDLNWEKTNDSLAIRSGRETQVVPFSKIHKIKGLQVINLGNSANFDDSFDDISYYQQNSSGDDITVNSVYPRWTRNVSDLNLSGYDLFTPPIIYVHEGRLTTRLPDIIVEEPPEPFGLQFVSASRLPYPFRLSSWIGDTPYFEDLKVFESPTSQRPVRNRLVPNVPYKRNALRKPGQPSLVACDLNDPERLLIIEHFVVQQHKNPQTGGLRPVGRAMVKDVSIPNAFEINSLMTEVYAGTVTFLFNVVLDGYTDNQIEFTSNDLGKNISIGGREFRIVKIDLDEKVVRISKRDPRILDLVEESFNF